METKKLRYICLDCGREQYIDYDPGNIYRCNRCSGTNIKKQDKFLEELEMIIDQYILEDSSKLTDEGRKFKCSLLRVITKIPYCKIALYKCW